MVVYGLEPGLVAEEKAKEDSYVGDGRPFNFYIPRKRGWNS